MGDYFGGFGMTTPWCVVIGHLYDVNAPIEVYLSGMPQYKYAIYCTKNLLYLHVLYRTLDKVYNQGLPGFWLERWLLD